MEFRKMKKMYCPHKRKMVSVDDTATICYENPKTEVCKYCFFNKQKQKR